MAMLKNLIKAPPMIGGQPVVFKGLLLQETKEIKDHPKYL